MQLDDVMTLPHDRYGKNNTPPLPAGLITGVGSLPFHDPIEAVRFVAQHCPRFPFWPQLPQRCSGEGVIAQGLGSLAQCLEPARRDYCWHLPPHHITAFQNRLCDETPGLSPETAPGFFAFEQALKNGDFPCAVAVKAQTEGPVTLTHCVFSQGAPLAVEIEWFEQAAAFLARQAVWQIERLQPLGLPIVFVFDEPALGLMGRTDSFFLAADTIKRGIDSMLNAVRDAGALAGIHCCSPPPLRFLSELHIDYLSFDASLVANGYDWFTLVRAVLENSGFLAFGLVPAFFSNEEKKDLDHPDQHWLRLATISAELEAVARRTIVTTTCGLGNISPALTHDAFAYCRAIANRIAKL